MASLVSFALFVNIEVLAQKRVVNLDLNSCPTVKRVIVVCTVYPLYMGRLSAYSHLSDILRTYETSANSETGE